MTGTTAKPRDHLFRMQIRMEIQPGKNRAFEISWLALADAARTHPANVAQSLARSVGETGVYYIVTDWVDELGYEDFVASQGFRQHIGAMRACIASDVMTSARVLHHLQGAGREQYT